MANVTIVQRIEFDAGHRIWGHESRCAHLHGHRYSAEIECTAPALDKLGRVVDFSVVKQVVGSWVNENWDHNILLHPQDPLAILWSASLITVSTAGMRATSKAVFAGKAPYIFPKGMNPTAENIASELLTIAQEMLSRNANANLEVVSVRVNETPNCSATATR